MPLNNPARMVSRMIRWQQPHGYPGQIQPPQQQPPGGANMNPWAPASTQPYGQNQQTGPMGGMYQPIQTPYGTGRPYNPITPDFPWAPPVQSNPRSSRLAALMQRRLQRNPDLMNRPGFQRQMQRMNPMNSGNGMDWLNRYGPFGPWSF